MSFNRLAVYAHRGWASSKIFASLANSGAPVRVLYRPGSDISNVPSGVEAVEVDTANQDALKASLKDIDILMYASVPASSKSHLVFEHIIYHVKLFVPSDLAFRCDEQGLRARVNRLKNEVEMTAKAAGIPMTIILPGLFAESALSTGLLVIDLAKNRIIFFGDSEHQVLNICTREYIAAAYASIFAQTPIADLRDRVIGLSELRLTGAEIAKSLELKHGSPPQIFRQNLAEVGRQFDKSVTGGLPLGIPYYCRYLWGAGGYVKAIGSDIWPMDGYRRKTLDELLNGGMDLYRDFPPKLVELVDRSFY
ncbi:hypothetical protein N7494_008524 [Penicillium frequentans]|uniref:NmrA-like domain-containing protein n=1 Tax=Penicillium frequentans TaxID=3151616 RepID=A0AAD6CN24_9EURO|nr:hypothetical protein N7494_008524 [Penicillium glabrum]